MRKSTSSDCKVMMRDLPLSAHNLLCTFGNHPKATPATVRDYASRYRAYFNFLTQAYPKRDRATLVKHVDAKSIELYADNLLERLGSVEARRTLTKLKAALASILPDQDLPDFRIEHARLRAIAKTCPEFHKQSFRYGVSMEAVPPALQPLFVAIESAVHRTRDGTIVGPLKGRDRLKRVLLRYLGALEAGGVAINELMIDHLTIVSNLEIYISRASDLTSSNSVKGCLYTLQSALRSISTPPGIATILARYGIGPPDRNTDYERFVPASERALFEQNLERAAQDRDKGELGALGTQVADKVRCSLGAFYRSLVGNSELEGRRIRDLPLAKAVDVFEAVMSGSGDTTLIARLTEIKAALDRIVKECPGPSTAYLGRRIRKLKSNCARNEVKVPAVTPKDIERLGCKLAISGYSRLRGLLKTKSPYCDLVTLAERCRDGVLLVLFSFIALRVSNMSSLTLKGTIIAGPFCWTIAIPAEYSKNGSGIFQTLPDYISRMLDRYNMVIRPLIAPIVQGVNDDVLWISRRGDRLSANSLQEIIPRHCREAFGIAINPHLLRAMEATDALETHPEDPNRGSSSLRHKSSAVTRRHYQSSIAVQRLPSLLSGVEMHDQALPDISPTSVQLGQLRSL